MKPRLEALGLEKVLHKVVRENLCVTFQHQNDATGEPLVAGELIQPAERRETLDQPAVLGRLDRPWKRETPALRVAVKRDLDRFPEGVEKRGPFVERKLRVGKAHAALHAGEPIGQRKFPLVAIEPARVAPVAAVRAVRRDERRLDRHQREEFHLGQRENLPHSGLELGAARFLQIVIQDWTAGLGGGGRPGNEQPGGRGQGASSDCW